MQSLHCRVSRRCCHCVLVLLMEFFFPFIYSSTFQAPDEFSVSCSKSHCSERCWISPQPFWTCQLSLFMYCSPLCPTLRNPWLDVRFPQAVTQYVPASETPFHGKWEQQCLSNPLKNFSLSQAVFVLAVPKFPLPLIDGKCIIQHKQGAHMMGWRDKTDGTWVTPIRDVGDENMLLL